MMNHIQSSNKPLLVQPQQLQFQPPPTDTMSYPQNPLEQSANTLPTRLNSSQLQNHQIKNIDPLQQGFSSTQSNDLNKRMIMMNLTSEKQHEPYNGNNFPSYPTNGKDKIIPSQTAGPISSPSEGIPKSNQTHIEALPPSSNSNTQQSLSQRYQTMEPPPLNQPNRFNHTYPSDQTPATQPQTYSINRGSSLGENISGGSLSPSAVNNQLQNQRIQPPSQLLGNQTHISGPPLQNIESSEYNQLSYQSGSQRINNSGQPQVISDSKGLMKPPIMRVNEPHMPPPMRVNEPHMPPPIRVNKPHMPPSMRVNEPHMPPPMRVNEPHMPPPMRVNEPHMSPPMRVNEPHMPPTMRVNEPHMPPPINDRHFKHPGGPMTQGGHYPQTGFQQQSGYPTSPGYLMQSEYPQQPGYNQQQAQQRRLDPDQMPSPIQVIMDDQANRAGTFITNQKGLVPPLVTTNFVVQDQGNASPRFIRSTMYNVPVSHDILKQTGVPFSLVISPMAKLVEGEYPIPIVNFGDLGPVRCIRCKAYMCPYMNFVDSGRRFQCVFCRATTDVPTEYFQHLDHTGQRMDRYERPELILGTYEFTATADYCRNNVLPKPPAIIFIIDVSYNSLKSGLVQLLCSQMKEILRNLPIDQGMNSSNMRVGFITYNNSVHFYNIKGTLSAPQMLVVGDTNEMFMPLLDGFLSTPAESEAIIDALMAQIPAMFADTKETETVLLPAIFAGLEALKASECSGKLLVFNSNLPVAEGPGKLKNRDDRKLLGTDKERTILTPQSQAYNQLGQDCVQAGCSVDLFVFNNTYIDIATIGQVSRLSGGEVFKYTYFQADIDGERLISDVIMDLKRPVAFDAIMRVRTSTGIRPTDFYGHFFMSNTTDIELASIDCDKSIVLEVKHDDKLQEEEGVYIQSALLYTSCSGQRRLRICNLALKTCSQMADLYRSCDLDTMINYISKQAIFKLMDNNPKAVKDSIITRAAQILATYRKNCASPGSAGQLILPECMKLLPLYVNCLLKSDALSGGSDMTVDDRSFVMQAVMTMDVPTSVHYFYPRLIPLHDIDSNIDNGEPLPIRCSIEKMSEHGIYILENGIHLFLWIGLGADPDLIRKLFGVQSAIQVNIEQTKLPELDNYFSSAVRNMIRGIRIQRHRHMRLTLVRQKEKLEPVFKHFLVEDRGNDGSPSYVDFLCHMHKEIRTILS